MSRHDALNREAFARAKTFIFTDIHREIHLAYASKQESGRTLLARAGIEIGGGNLLAALGLLCYTEFGGKLKYNCKKRNGDDHASENFNRFFDDLGDGYKEFRASGNNVYDIFRCGLVHLYYVKRDCTIYMLGKRSNAGIGKEADGIYYFVVEQYCQDLEQAFAALESHLFQDNGSAV